MSPWNMKNSVKNRKGKQINSFNNRGTFMGYNMLVDMKCFPIMSETGIRYILMQHIPFNYLHLWAISGGQRESSHNAVFMEVHNVQKIDIINIKYLEKYIASKNCT